MKPHGPLLFTLKYSFCLFLVFKIQCDDSMMIQINDQSNYSNYFFFERVADNQSRPS